jgi:hypothetical protein
MDNLINMHFIFCIFGGLSYLHNFGLYLARIIMIIKVEWLTSLRIVFIYFYIEVKFITITKLECVAI